MSEALAGLSRFALRGVFNNAEIIALFQHRETLEYLRSAMTERFEIDVHSISEDLRRSEQFFVPQYVMKINTPRYHENVNCGLISSKFENFETPPQIQALGDERVEAFQVFCEQEWPRYRSGPIDVFWVHVGAQFGVSINPREISYAAQEGPEPVSAVKEEELLVAEINRKVNQLSVSAMNEGVQGHLCAPPRKLFELSNELRIDQSRREAYRKILGLKRLIRNMMIELHRIELQMPEGLLSTEILNALGFLPCKACCNVGKRPR